ncbi:hypothetical protein NV226_00240 [Mycoplasma iguanae]|uniref:Uncharacterized protein n=1 Tax=Mycoplasma iguanae TaxID=292461 RepID=A0ABY5R8B9_9MOLU|nr:hypothetical protein [Mycoplasma iguanae]UVD81739.1 hypothetical protein NV226_00240 [Mycoplasma iguanae]
MKIKPRVNNSDFFSDTESLEIQKPWIPDTKHQDPKEIISSGIYKVFRIEKIIHFFNTVLLSTLLLVSTLFILAIHFNWFKLINKELEFTWSWYILPAIVIACALTKLSLTLIEWNALNKTIKYYRQSLLKDEKYTPSYVVRLYKNTVLKQVHHNWLTIFIVFYGSIFTILFWLLRDQVWLNGLIDFKSIINQFYFSPETMTIIFSVVLILIIVLQVVFMIIRRKKMIDIETFFGHEVVSESQVIEIKKQRNKILFRLFIFSIAIILIIPIITLLIVKALISRKRK